MKRHIRLRVCHVTGSGEKRGRLFVPTQSQWTSSSHQHTQNNAASQSAVCSSHSQFLNQVRVWSDKAIVAYYKYIACFGKLVFVEDEKDNKIKTKV